MHTNQHKLYLLFLTIVLVSCVQQISPELIYGKWRSQNSSESYTIEFFSQNKMQITYYDNNSSWTDSYKVEEDKIYFDGVTSVFFGGKVAKLNLQKDTLSFVFTQHTIELRREK